jgi:hypothetical protein
MSTGAKSDLNADYFQAINPGTSWKLDFTNTSAQIGPFDDDTSLISIFPTQDCWVLAGSNPTAVPISSGSSGTSKFCPGGIQDFIGVKPGQKLAIIRDTVNGSVHVCECANAAQ